MKNKRLTVLYVASTYSHIEAFHLPYIDALKKDGHRVFTLANGESADYNVGFVKSLFSLGNLTAIISVKRILKQLSPDVIILNTALASVLTRLALPHKSRAKVINISHGYLFFGQLGIFRSLVAFACELLLSARTDAVITMNKTDHRMALKYSFTRGRVYLTRGMGVRISGTDASRSHIRRTYGLSGFVMMFIGELSDRKNQRFLISCMPYILKAVPSAMLVLVGGGDRADALKKQAKFLNVSQNVRFLGYIPEAQSLITMADLYVSASLAEGLPFNVVEAMAHGVPLLISDIKGHTDIVGDKNVGVLYKSENKADFVNKTCQLYNKILTINTNLGIERSKKFGLDAAFPAMLNIIRRELEGGDD